MSVVRHNYKQTNKKKNKKAKKTNKTKQNVKISVVRH